MNNWSKKECKILIKFVVLMIEKGWATKVIIDKEKKDITLVK